MTTTTTVAVPAQRPAPDSEHADMWALVERAQAGDRAAFGEIYGRYEDKIFRFVYFRVDARPLAEDITADTFFRAFNRIDSFTWQGRDLGAWLVTIARNLIADHFKSGRYRLEVATGLFDTAEGANALPLADAAPGHVIKADLSHAVQAAIAKLPTPNQREVIRLRFFEDLSVTETAMRMGINEGATKVLQYRAVKSLRRLAPELEAHR